MLSTSFEYKMCLYTENMKDFFMIIYANTRLSIEMNRYTNIP